jgi:hypothetical protein
VTRLVVEVIEVGLDDGKQNNHGTLCIYDTSTIVI